MKKLFLLNLLLLLLIGCSKDKEEPLPNNSLEGTMWGRFFYTNPYHGDVYIIFHFITENEVAIYNATENQIFGSERLTYSYNSPDLVITYSDGYVDTGEVFETAIEVDDDIYIKITDDRFEFLTQDEGSGSNNPINNNLENNYINVNGVKVRLEKAFIERRKLYGDRDILFIQLTDKNAEYDERRNKIFDHTYKITLQVYVPDSEFIRTGRYPFFSDLPEEQLLPDHYVLHAHFTNDGSIPSLETVLYGNSGVLNMGTDKEFLYLKFDIISLSNNEEYLIGEFLGEFIYFES